MNFEDIVDSISFDEFKASFLTLEEKNLQDALKTPLDKKTRSECQDFLQKVQAQLSDADRENAKTKANDTLYNIAYFARAVSKMHPGFSPEGIQAGFDTEDFKEEVVKLYEKYQKNNLPLTNEHEVNQLLTDCLGIALTTLQDNHFDIKTSQRTRVYQDEEKTMKEWTRNRPLKVHHPEKGNVGENVAYTPDSHIKILFRENMGTDENPRPLIVGERAINGKTYGVVGLSGIFIHWGTPRHGEEIKKVEKMTQTFERHYKKWNGVIIDIRGNTGGDGTASRKITELLCGEKTPYCLKATKRKTQEAALREIGSTAIQEEPEWTPKTFHGSHEVFVLTDCKTGSASESFVPMLRHYESATFVGENTNGCCQYGGTKPVPFPCGGIMQIGTVFRTYEDGMIECIGHKPDIDCRGKDALQVVFDRIADGTIINRGITSGPHKGETNLSLLKKSSDGKSNTPQNRKAKSKEMDNSLLRLRWRKSSQK